MTEHRDPSAPQLDDALAPHERLDTRSTASTVVRGRPASDGRTRRAIATRARLTTAARTLFVRDGYASTTVAAVARAAGVAEQTVYYSYPTKAELLVGCLDHAVDGTDRVPGHAPADLTGLAWVRTALEEPDASQRLFLHVRGFADLMSRAAPLLDVLRLAGAGEASLAQAWEQDESRRRAVHEALVETYLRDAVPAQTTEHPPAPGPEGATDVVGLVLGPETWNALVGRAGWSRLAWARWAHRSLLAELAPGTVLGSST
ncbi:TetR/AcrR family transcriptional regulator [Cellulomonas soli]|uniref:TetR family transcriptional regulator n=1 Tax=Cellulomonas soli TaxID=931535 RepID=A0A512PFN5_9CELL|nr:TetR/AcrR family transcriptional regulator [Cellulomonas soli]NYI59842.1 AcrR family transcriptional regulator [Cellulomonas soli]GEP70014.1 TetR family transcriptional regulator [Cellulomonas soli]